MYYDEAMKQWSYQDSGARYFIAGDLKTYYIQYSANDWLRPSKTSQKYEVRRGTLGDFMVRDTNNVNDKAFYPMEQALNKVLQAIYENIIARSIVE